MSSNTAYWEEAADYTLNNFINCKVIIIDKLFRSKAKFVYFLVKRSRFAGVFVSCILLARSFRVKRGGVLGWHIFIFTSIFCTSRTDFIIWHLFLTDEIRYIHGRSSSFFARKSMSFLVLCTVIALNAPLFDHFEYFVELIRRYGRFSNLADACRRSW